MNTEWFVLVTILKPQPDDRHTKHSILGKQIRIKIANIDSERPSDVDTTATNFGLLLDVVAAVDKIRFSDLDRESLPSFITNNGGVTGGAIY
jgi:hypothetical protein